MEKNKIITEFGNASIIKGYYKITSKKEGNFNKLLHRLIYEKHYGKIPNNMVVHHKDMNSLNNNISNLELLSRGEHASLHHKGVKMSEELRENLSKSRSGNKNPMWKDYPRILKKNKLVSGKQRYSLKYNGKILTTSININYLKRIVEVMEANNNDFEYAKKVVDEEENKPSIRKDGFTYNGKQNYAIISNGKRIKTSINYNKLVEYIETNLS